MASAVDAVNYPEEAYFRIARRNKSATPLGYGCGVLGIG